MGLEGTATRMIWIVAAIGAFGSAVVLSFDVLANDHAMTMGGASSAPLRFDARMADGIFCYDPGLAQIEITATNAADPLDLTNVSVLVEGIPRDANATVDGIGTTPVWPSSEVASFTVGVDAEPERVLLVSPRGTTLAIEQGTCPVLTTAVISPSDLDITVGGQQTFTVTGYDQFGAPISGYTFVWTTDAGSVSSLTATTGQLTASTTSATGRTVTATAGAVSAVATVDILPDVPASVTVSPTPVSVAAGGTQAFTATVRDQYGNVNSTSTVTWSSNTGSITVGGVLTAPTTTASGRTVTATTSNGVSGTATVHIVPAALSSITVTPSSAALLTNGVQAFTAQGYDQYGNARSGDTFTWSATSGSITSAGVYTAPTTTGSATVTATSGSVQGTASVTITKQTHVGSMATYNGASPQTTFAKGQTVTTRVTILDHNNTAVNGATVNIEIRDPSNVLRCNCSGTTNAAGLASIPYTLPNANLNGQWTVRVTLVTLSGTTYTPSANVVTTINFTEA